MRKQRLREKCAPEARNNRRKAEEDSDCHRSALSQSDLWDHDVTPHHPC